MARRSGQTALPPPLEMACLGVVWTRGEATVRDVVADLATRQQFAYTTVMTLLERLVRRGHLNRQKVGRSFRYSPSQDPAELREIAISELVRHYFGGQRDALRLWLDGGHPTPAANSPKEDALEPSGSNDPIDTALL
jgi:predicted transcriptional regulator